MRPPRSIVTLIRRSLFLSHPLVVLRSQDRCDASDRHVCDPTTRRGTLILWVTYGVLVNTSFVPVALEIEPLRSFLNYMCVCAQNWCGEEFDAHKILYALQHSITSIKSLMKHVKYCMSRILYSIMWGHSSSSRHNLHNEF